MSCGSSGPCTAPGSGTVPWAMNPATDQACPDDDAAMCCHAAATSELVIGTAPAGSAAASGALVAAVVLVAACPCGPAADVVPGAAAPACSADLAFPAGPGTVVAGAPGGRPREPAAGPKRPGPAIWPASRSSSLNRS